ncbi:MAG: hypothetical protein CMH57_02000 [Myxococcales bacterium]|nr:hypothetical protein [Myxococcales bacterium]
MSPRMSAVALLALLLGCSSSAEQVMEDDTPPTAVSEEAEPAKLGPQGPDVLIGSAPSERELPVAKQAADGRALLVAIDTPYQIFKEQGTYIHVASWQQDGAPAANANVYVGSTQVGQTDPTGTLVFLYPPRGSGGSALDANVITVVDASQPEVWGAVPFNPHLRTASFASDHLFVYTDRGVYRPGETVRTRILGWHLEADYAPLSEAAVDVLLKGPGGRVVAGGQRVTSALGVAHMEMEVPRSVPDGLYTLEVAYKNERASARLQVKEFKPPAIQIEHTLGRFLTRDQQALEFELHLKPSSGGELGRADVTARFLSGGGERLKLTRAVKGGGPHRFALNAKQLGQVRADLVEGSFLTAQIAIRDDAGRTSELDRELRYTANPYVAVLETDKDQYTTGDPVEIIAKVSDLDGVPQRDTALRLTIDAQTLSAKTDQAGLARFSLKMPELNVTARLMIDGVKDPIASAPLRWIAPRPMTSHIKDPIIKERQTARVVVAFPANVEPAEQVVHMDVVDTSGALVNAVLLPIREVSGGYEASGEFEAPSWGSMLLTFFALGRAKGAAVEASRPHHSLGLLTEGQNLVVQPDKTLTITLDGVPDAVQPGAEVDLGVRVTSATGQEVKASVGAAVVDRRVISLKDPLEITPMDHFYNPELRTMSTTGSKILSWPVVSRNWGGRVHDVALPPFPFLEGGAVVHRHVRASKNTGSWLAEGGGDGAADSDSSTAPPPPPTDGEMIAPKYKAEMKKAAMEEKAAQAQAKKVKVMKAKISLDETMIEGKMMKPEAEPVGGLVDRRRGEGRAADTPVKITVRTRFPETSLWEPDRVVDGATTIKARMPDAMAEQEVILVASDAHGGVGGLRQTLQVNQPVYVQADMPRALRVGEVVEVPVLVQNQTAQAETFSLELELQGEKRTKRVQVGARDAQVVTVEVSARAPGRAPYTLIAEGGRHRDEVRGHVRVTPSGVSTLSVSRGVASASAPFSQSWEVAPDVTGHAAWLQVTFPAVTSAFIGVDALTDAMRERPLAMASDLVSVALLLQYAQRHNVTSPKLTELRYRLLDTIGQLQYAQNPDGSFSFWRNGAKSAYVTAWALEAILEAQQLDAPVNQEVIRKASLWLANHIQKDGLIEVDDVAFWQGDTRAVRLGLTAEVYDVLSRVPANLRSKAVQGALTRLAKTYKAVVTQPGVDPLAAGRALTALSRDRMIDRATALAVVKNLLTQRDRGHWEPSWFHAYGGNIEATVAMLQAMQQIDPDGLQAEKRDALRYILATRDAWGQWHNERGTAAALRALLLVGGGLDEVPGVITVKLDGEVIKTVKVDPADPFLSAVNLSHLTLGEGLKPGKHVVTVDYDGRLSPSVALVTRTWRAATARRGSAHGLEVSAQGAAAMKVGQEARLSLTIASPEPQGAARLVIGPSSLVEVDLAQLSRAEQKAVTGARLTSRGVELDVLAGKGGTVQIPVRAVGLGEGAWPTVSLESRDRQVMVTAGALRVSP